MIEFSNSYIFYPGNKALHQALTHYESMLPHDSGEDIKPDNTITVPDNFTNTRGNYEQRGFSSNVLENARAVLEARITEDLRHQTPLEWATTQNSLGNVLAAQGQQQRDGALYQQAIQSFGQALEEIDQEHAPMDWAATQYNLGTAMQALGRQLGESKLLKRAIDAYTNALLEWTREHNPPEWASTMHQLGTTLHTHGLLLKGNRTFQKSVVAYKNALAELDADNNALELAAAHNNRGVVLHHLGESEENAERLEEAIRSYETALTVCMEQQQPIHLAVLCRINRATARSVLAALTSNWAAAEEAADEFEVILEVFQNACQPLSLKHCEAQLDKARSMVKSLSKTQ